jgi:hypothetical protein
MTYSNPSVSPCTPTTTPNTSDSPRNGLLCIYDEAEMPDGLYERMKQSLKEVEEKFREDYGIRD